jgi:hypothetical protein
LVAGPCDLLAAPARRLGGDADVDAMGSEKEVRVKVHGRVSSMRNPFDRMRATRRRVSPAQPRISSSRAGLGGGHIEALPIAQRWTNKRVGFDLQLVSTAWAVGAGSLD